MNDTDKTPFSKILAELTDRETIFRPSRLFQLSSLSKEDAAELARVWEQIPLDRRRNLLTDMEEFAPADPLLFFDQVALIALHDSDPVARTSAVRLISLEEEPLYARNLLDLLRKDEHFEVRTAAAIALGKFVYLGEIEELPADLYEQIEDGLLQAYREDPQVAVRQRALEAIGFSSRDEINDMIEDAFNSGDEDWQVSALFAMGASANQRWEDTVVSMLDADSAMIRTEAARAAGKLDLKTTRKTLFDIAENDEDAETRAAAIWALSDIGGPEVSEFLDTLLAEAETEADEDFLEAAIENLMESEMFNDLDLPLFDFGDDDLLDANGFDPNDEGDA